MFLLWIVLIVVLIVLVAVGTLVWGTIFGRGEVTPAREEPAAVRTHNAQAVADGNLDDVRFDLVLRGYRPDQVDPVIEQLAARVAELESQTAGNV